MRPTRTEGTSVDFPVRLLSDRSTRIALVRHGRTDWNATHRFLGRTDRPLDDVGREQAACLGGHFRERFDAVYASPLKRAMQTAEYLTSTVTKDQGLIEFDVGEFDGRPLQDVMKDHSAFMMAWSDDPGPMTPPGGSERFEELRDRSVASLSRIALQHPLQDVAVVCHQMVIGALVSVAAGEPLVRWRSHTVGNAHVTWLEIAGVQWAVLDENIGYAS